MPTSHMHQLNEIIEIIVLSNPQTILDVGVGFGKYGVLAREFLELRDGRDQYSNWQRRIDGIEAFATYLTPLHQFIYNTVYIGDAIDVLPSLPVTYDLILLIDVLEHFTQEKGTAVLQACLQKGRNVLISTPGWFFQQGTAFNNPYEQHLSFWTKADFAAFTPKCFVPNDISLICLIGPASKVAQQELYGLRRRLKRDFAFLKYLYRLVRRKRKSF
jgi:hypothetical protein